MYVGRRLRYNKVVPICAMEGDKLSGGIAPFIFKLRSDRCEWSDRLHWPPYCQRKSWIWRLDECRSWSGCSGEGIVFLILPCFEPHIFQHIS